MREGWITAAKPAQLEALRAITLGAISVDLGVQELRAASFKDLVARLAQQQAA